MAITWRLFLILRFKYSIIAGIISVVIYAIIAGGYSVGEGAEELLLASMDPKPLVMLIPVITMLIIAIRTRNIFRAIITGLIFGTIIGLGFGLITPESILSCTDGAMEGYLYTGFTGMIGVALIILCLNGVMGVMREAGALDALVSAINYDSDYYHYGRSSGSRDYYDESCI